MKLTQKLGLLVSIIFTLLIFFSIDGYSAEVVRNFHINTPQAKAYPNVEFRVTLQVTIGESEHSLSLEERIPTDFIVKDLTNIDILDKGRLGFKHDSNPGSFEAGYTLVVPEQITNDTIIINGYYKDSAHENAVEIIGDKKFITRETYGAILTRRFDKSEFSAGDIIDVYLDLECGDAEFFGAEDYKPKEWCATTGKCRSFSVLDFSSCNSKSYHYQVTIPDDAEGMYTFFGEFGDQNAVREIRGEQVVYVRKRDVINPTINISSQNERTEYTTNKQIIDLFGTAFDNDGLSKIVWSINGVYNEILPENLEWGIKGIQLIAGVNRIGITAFDRSGNTNSDSITVIYTPEATSTELAFKYDVDVNGDRKINIADLISALQISTGLPSNDTVKLSADVNNDNRIGIEEAILVSQINSDSIAVGNGISITSPDLPWHITSEYGPVHLTENPLLSVSGTTPYIFGIVHLKWTNMSNNISGVCKGTTSWICPDISLTEGINDIYISAYDEGNDSLSSSLPIFFQPTLDFGLVAYYPFNGNANDESGNENYGTVNGATLINDRFGNPNSAYVFDGRNDYIDCGNGASLNIKGPDSSITMSAWFYAYNNSSNQYLLSKGRDYTPNYGYHLNINNNTSRGLYRLTTGNNIVETDPTLETNKWYHVVTTFDGIESMIYIDGQLKNSTLGKGEIGPSSTNLIIGCHSPYPPTWYMFDGIIDDVRIYNRALSEAEIASLYDLEVSEFVSP